MVLCQMTPSCSHGVLVSYQFVLYIVLCSLLCTPTDKVETEALQVLFQIVCCSSNVCETIDRIGTSSTVSFSDILCTLAVVQNLTGQDPLGYKRKYSCCGDLFFIFHKICYIFPSVFLVGSWSSVLKKTKKTNHKENKCWCEK